MPRYIDADALLKRIPPGKIILSSNARYKIITAPTADVQKVRHGKWIVSGMFDDFLKCSICGFETTMFNAFNYCPMCGLKMDVKEKEE